MDSGTTSYLLPHNCFDLHAVKLYNHCEMSDTADTQTRKPRFRTIGRKDGLVDRVVDSIQAQILSGQLAVGARLLGVSRTVVREAVCILVTKGLLETRHGVGTTVHAFTRQEAIKPLTMFLRTCGQEVSIEHLYQVRSILEVENAGLAAEKGCDADVGDLRAICAEMEAVAGAPERFAAKDDEFHRRLAQTTHNPLLVLLLDSIHDMMTEVRVLVAQKQGLFEQVMPSHKRIVECVAARDARGARRAMREHLVVALAIQSDLILNASA
jgi:DNA-binding FadR family transcriptional regulator